MNIPYDTGKVLIGINYVKPPQRLVMSADMERLQAALLKFKWQPPQKGK